jgi:glucose/arabinose dehydrogenase
MSPHLPKRAALFVTVTLPALGFLLAGCSSDDKGNAVSTVQSGIQGGADTPQATSGAATPAPGTSPPRQGGSTPTAQTTPAPAATQASGPSITLKDSNLKADRISGLSQPTQIAFLGADDLLITEKTGRVVRVRGSRIEGPVAELKANFADERGVLGITLHPDFATNHFVYVYWTWTGEGAEPGGIFGAPTDDIEKVPPLGNRIDRFVWDGALLNFDRNIIQLPSRTTDLTLNRRRGNHDGAVVKFGPDGKLYAVIGDQNFRGRLQNVPDGPDLTGPDALQGVVLRLNDDGSVPPDNPFVSFGDDRAKIFIYGLRNSFGFDFDPMTGQFWLQVNGQASYDEIGRYQAGDNIGWIQMMGPPERFLDYKNLEIDTDRKLDSPAYPPVRLANSPEEALQRLVMLPGSHYRQPLFAWRIAVAPAGMGFVKGTALGGDYNGDLLVGDVNTGSIYRFKLTQDRQNLNLGGSLSDKVNDNSKSDPIGELKGGLFASGLPVGTDIKSGPDGTLWITSLGTQSLYRITKR